MSQMGVSAVLFQAKAVLHECCGAFAMYFVIPSIVLSLSFSSFLVYYIAAHDTTQVSFL